MKRTLFFLILLLVTNTISNAQNRIVARGAEPGELYLTCFWYGIFDPMWGPPYYDTLYSAVYRVTEHGKKLSIPYDFDLLSPYYPQNEMLPERILADATPGVVYCTNYYYKDNDLYKQLWVSFDYGKNWILREENTGSISYFAAGLKDSVIYKGGGDQIALQSRDYGESFNFLFTVPTSYSTGEIGYQECEFFGFRSYPSYQLQHTNDCANTFTQIPIDEQHIFGNIGGVFPDIYRGSLPGEVYISSYFPDTTYSSGIYKVSFSADTGYTFRHVYICDKNCYNPFGYLAGYITMFMSDREPGVFYILKLGEVIDSNPWGLHLKLCIEYYRDYGETLESIFCHDITKDYEYEEVVCDNRTFLTSKVENQNSVQLQWSTSEDSAFIRGYYIYRNNIRITNELLTETIYLDENLPNGEYVYYVKTYREGCVSDTSNYIVEKIELGVKELEELEGVRVFPNPTTGELKVESGKLKVDNVEVFDVYGKKLSSNHLITSSSNHQINISHLSAGIYFLKIDNEMVKVIKQ